MIIRPDNWVIIIIIIMETHLSWKEIHLSLREIHLLKLDFQDIVVSCTVGFVGILHLINFLFMDDLDIKILVLLYFNMDYLVGLVDKLKVIDC
jgi:hypothetical protein